MGILLKPRGGGEALHINTINDFLDAWRRGGLLINDSLGGLGSTTDMIKNMIPKVWLTNPWYLIRWKRTFMQKTSWTFHSEKVWKLHFYEGYIKTGAEKKQQQNFIIFNLTNWNPLSLSIFVNKGHFIKVSNLINQNPPPSPLITSALHCEWFQKFQH